MRRKTAEAENAGRRVSDATVRHQQEDRTVQRRRQSALRSAEENSREGGGER